MRFIKKKPSKNSEMLNYFIELYWCRSYQRFLEEIDKYDPKDGKIWKRNALRNAEYCDEGKVIQES